MYVIAEKKCPYCNVELAKEPKRGSACKKCGKKFHVVSHPKDKKKVIVTQEEYQAFQLEWLGQGELKSLRDTVSFSYPDGTNFDKKFENEEKILTKKYDAQPQAKDVVWGMANQQLQEKMRVGDLGGLANLYRGMARYLYVSGKQSTQLQQEALKCELRFWVQLGFTETEIISADVCCDTCKPLNHKKIEIAQAIKEMPLPQIKCSNFESFAELNPATGWCLCAYVTVTD